MSKLSQNGFSSPHLRFSLLASSILFFATLTIAGSFLLVHQQRLADMNERAMLTQNILFEHATDKSPLELETLKQNAAALIQLSDFQGIALFDGDNTKLFEFGLPIEPKSIPKLCTTATTIRANNAMFTSIQIEGPDQSSQCLITRIDTTLASLVNLEFILFLSMSLVFCALLCIFFYKKLNRDIFDPLEIINETISKQNKSKQMTPMTLENPGVFEELIQQTNERILLRIEQEVDFREHAEQANKELKETLDAMEVKNIEIDITRKNAQELNKLKSDFLNKTSQDLKTPVSGILRFVDFLRQTKLSKQQRDFTNSIQETARSMMSIINDINDFSKIESGDLTTERKPLDIRLCVEDVLGMQVTLANEYRVNLHSTYDSKLPTTVVGDAMRLQQVLSNLLSNAIRFDDTDNVEVAINVLARTNDRYELAIVVSCDGICPEELQSWQESGASDYSMITKEFYSSVGVNLSIAKGLLRQLNGKLNFIPGVLQRFELVVSFDISEKDDIYQPIKHNLDINAIVFNHTDFGYNEVSNRLKSIGAKHQRVREFSDLPRAAKQLQIDALTKSRQLNIAIIESAAAQQSLQKIMLNQTVKTLKEDLNIPVVVIANNEKLDTIEECLKDSNCEILTHPLNSKRFYQCINDELGIRHEASKSEHVRNNNNAKRLEILLVEDSEPNLKLAKTVLKEADINVIAARSGHEAVEHFKKGRKFDLVFMDIELPDFNGMETTRKIRAIETSSRTPIIALSAHDVDTQKAELLLNDLDDAISKPLSIEKINYLIKRWIHHAEASLQPAHIHTRQHTRDTSLEPKAKSSPIHIGTSLALANNNAQLAEEMLTTFVHSLKDEEAQIKVALKTDDLDALYNAVHRIRGACCYCGAPRLKSISQILDTKLRKGEIISINQNLDELLSAIEEILNWEEEHEIQALFN